MRIFRLGAAISGGLMLVIAACAQTEAPTTPMVQAEPTYDKYGNASCRPERQPVSSTFPARLPICEDLCREGSVVPGTADVLACPPPPQRRPDDNGRDDTDTGRTPGTTPTRG